MLKFVKKKEIFVLKQLFIIRHAKSSWGTLGLNDFDRPLNERGNRDAPMMAKRLWNRNIHLDAIVTSPANRAMSTARYFSAENHLNEQQWVEIPSLYHAPASRFYDVIQKDLPDNWNTVALFSHNPGITDFVNSTGLLRLDNMPTTGIFGISVETAHWKDFRTATKSFLFFDYPKLFAGM